MNVISRYVCPPVCCSINGPASEFRRRDGTERSGDREDARATLSDQQVNNGTPRYPVDRYLVERSNKLEMVNIIDDDIWNAEPALRPEDEIVLRKLHDMLQSTADDLKLLSGELSKYHGPGVQVKSLPTPLDEDFNEKVHIEELVNAKFHGYKVVDKFQSTSVNVQRGKVGSIIKPVFPDARKPQKLIDSSVQVNQHPTTKKKNNLTVSRTKIVQINENVNEKINANAVNSYQNKDTTKKPTVAYKELSFKYVEPDIEVIGPKPLLMQNMPSINIRGELKEQKVLQLNIEPNIVKSDQNEANRSNIAVISVQHKPVSVPKIVPTANVNQVQYPIIPIASCNKEPVRKFLKISSCESSEVDSNVKVNSIGGSFRKIKSYRASKMAIKLPPRHCENIKNRRNISSKKESTKYSNSNLDIWKKKLNAVYGCPTSSRKSKLGGPENSTNKNETKYNSSSCSQSMKTGNILNNAEYIPYSKLTLGGARVSDIEKELSGIPNKTTITLGPILNKILSRENSFQHESPRVNIAEESPKILTTSDENLLQEVLDIERKVNKTLTNEFTEHNAHCDEDPHSNVFDDQHSYADDFEDEKSDYSGENVKQLSDDEHSDEINLGKSHNTDMDNKIFKGDSKKKNLTNKQYTKSLSLSLKKKVDVFEFVHNIDRQDTGTQSNTTQKISLKETQTSPRNDKCNVQPIHNDLWPSIDPKGEVEKLFQLEKDFIKKLIFDEYGDLLEKNLNKPSTSKRNQDVDEKNITSSQKNTQTSPAHVKSVMTSPTRNKTRTTSPFATSLTIDQQTSPINEEIKINVETGDDLGLSINLSSPRFSLKLPQTSREIISNLESRAHSNRNATDKASKEKRPVRKNIVSSSTSADGDYSSSDISSLGEVRFKLKRLRKMQVPTLSEFSSPTSLSKDSSDISDAIFPLRSEGEVSFGQVQRRRSDIYESEGEGNGRFLH